MQASDHDNRPNLNQYQERLAENSMSTSIEASDTGEPTTPERTQPNNEPCENSNLVPGMHSTPPKN